MSPPRALYAPAVHRNREPILAVLRRFLPAAGTVIEVGSGTGEHAVWFAAHLPGLDWQPSDPEAQARASIAVRVADAGLDNLAEPLDLDVTAPDWDAALDGPCDAIVCINVLHITPWAVAEGLMRGACRLLNPGGILYLYGPYKRDGQHSAPSNAAFDASLRQRDPAWGVRDITDVADCAEANGLALDHVVDMPRDNFSLVFRRAAR